MPTYITLGRWCFISNVSQAIITIIIPEFFGQNGKNIY